MAHTLPTRSQVDPANTWAITDLYPSDQAWREACENVRGLVRDLAAYRGRLGESAATLLAFLRLQDEIDLQGDRMISYAFRKSDEDTRNPVYQEMSAQAQNFLVELSQALSFQTPELLAIEDATLESFYEQEPALAHYRLMLKRIRSKKDHTLSPDCEALLASAERMGQAPDDIFSLLNDADMTYPDATDSKGETHPVTHGNYVFLLQSADRTLRQSAFQSLYSVYGQFRNTCAAILGAQMKQLQFFADARRYPSALHAALAETEVDPQIYHNLIQTVHDNLDAMHRYVRLRKKLLGVDKLHYYDLYTPIVADEDASIPFEQGKDMAREALKPLGEDYLKILNEGFDNRWIDVYENQGKRSGAYSAGVYGVHPYVLLNYEPTLDSLFTIAHELGHSMHTFYSDKNQAFLNSEYPLFLAEIASTTNEAILLSSLKEKFTRRDQRMALCNYQLEQIRGTVYRQTLFAEFEREVHAMAMRGEALTAEALTAVYRRLNEVYYKGAVVDDDIAIEWMRIPHFYRAFYVYQYATGYSAAVAFSRRVLSGDAHKRDQYLGFLASGSSKPPLETLRLAGVDMESPEPVEECLRSFEEALDEMERLMEEA